MKIDGRTGSQNGRSLIVAYRFRCFNLEHLYEGFYEVNNIILLQVVGVASLACGLIAIATSNSDVTSVILQTMMERSSIELKDHYAKFLALGLGLTYLGKFQDLVSLSILTWSFTNLVSIHIPCI